MNKIRHDIYSALAILMTVLSLAICYFVYDSSYADIKWEKEETLPELSPSLRPLPQWDEVVDSEEVLEVPVEAEVATEVLVDKRIIIDPGHGGKDRGQKGVTRRLYESNVDRNAAMILYRMIEEDEELKKAGIYPYLIRDEDVFVDDKDRIYEAGKGCAFYISLHCASTSSGRKSDMSGAVIKYKAADKDGSFDLADRISASLKDSDVSVRGPVVGDDEYILRNNKCPAIMVEMGYLTNDEDCKKLSSSKYLTEIMKVVFLEVKNESLTGNRE